MKKQIFIKFSAALLIFPSISALAGGNSPLLHGQWEITRHDIKFGDVVRDVKFNACTNPVETHEEQKKLMSKGGLCKYETPVYKGDTLTYNGKCTAAGITTTYQSVFTFQGNSRYVLRESATTPNQPTRSTHISGIRIGDC